MDKKIINKNTIILIVIALLSAAIRLYINFYTEFIPGAVGSYYILQVRSILENGHLIQREFPLIFYLEAAFAKVVLLLFKSDLMTTVDYTSRIFDAVVPVVSIFPAFKLVKDILGKNFNKFASIVISSFAVYYISFFILVSEYQKNSLGILWLMFYMLFIYRSLTTGGKRNYFSTILFLVLTGLTHFGCFTIAIFFTVTVVSFNYLTSINLKRLARLVTIILTICIAGVSVIYTTAPAKAGYFFELLSESFKKPIIISSIQGEPVLSPGDIISVLFLNFCAITALIVYLLKKNLSNNNEKIFFLSVIMASLILSSPFLGNVWALRLYYISYILAIPQITYIYRSLRGESQRRIIIVISIFVLALSLIATITKTPVSSMNRECYAELNSMKPLIHEKDSNMIIAREGLHYWTGLVFNSRVAQPENIHKGWWNRFDHIYYLIQIKDIVQFGLAGLYGEPFPEPKPPDTASLIYSGYFYKLYLAPYPPPGLKK